MGWDKQEAINTLLDRRAQLLEKREALRRRLGQVQKLCRMVEMQLFEVEDQLRSIDRWVTFYETGLDDVQKFYESWPWEVPNV